MSQVTTLQRAEIVQTLENSEQYRSRRVVKSEDGKREYTVAIRNSDSRWTCGCMGWTRTCNPKGTDCKHIKAVKALCGMGVEAAHLAASDIVAALRMLAADAVTVAADEILNRWLKVQSTAMNLLTYFSLLDDPAQSQAYEALFNDVREKVIAAAMA